MQKAEVERILAKLLTQYLIYAPVKNGAEIRVKKINVAEDIDWSGDLPADSFKRLFLPAEEIMFALQENQGFEAVNGAEAKTIAWGMNILDLQAFTLLENVFEKDIFYQERRRNTIVVGFTNGLPEDFRKYRVFHQDYEENILEHLVFDVFIERQKNGNFIFFSGSQNGQKFLESVGVEDYQNVEFAGLVPEAGLSPRLLANKNAVVKSVNNKIWEELAEICLACGKCSVVCPTCYCFDAVDEVGLTDVKKVRHWGSCFYPEFSKTAGNFKELDSVKKRLFFWYYHKFVRIPDELAYYGCVSCMRCFKVCPVGINIAKNLQTLQPKK